MRDLGPSWVSQISGVSLASRAAKLSVRSQRNGNRLGRAEPGTTWSHRWGRSPETPRVGGGQKGASAYKPSPSLPASRAPQGPLLPLGPPVPGLAQGVPEPGLSRDAPTSACRPPLTLHPECPALTFTWTGRSPAWRMPVGSSPAAEPLSAPSPLAMSRGPRRPGPGSRDVPLLRDVLLLRGPPLRPGSRGSCSRRRRYERR